MLLQGLRAIGLTFLTRIRSSSVCRWVGCWRKRTGHRRISSLSLLLPSNLLQTALHFNIQDLGGCIQIHAKASNSHQKEEETIFLSSLIIAMVPCARKLFCYKSDPCRVPALSRSGLAWASPGAVHREGRQFYLLQFPASCNGDVCPDCPMLIQQQESANQCFSKAAMQTREVRKVL